jgi:phosphomannomutase
MAASFVMLPEAIVASAEAWLAHDPDPETRKELRRLIDVGSLEVVERFAGPLAFGTAGLRGLIGAGESRMNRAVVRRTTLGLGRYLLAHEPDATERGVVIGFDGRRFSAEFAADAAAVLGALGIPVHLAARLCPTPLVAFAVTALGACAGVMVTASHNPPDYNGYKVYGRNGAQIIPPADGAIARAIADAGPADAIALMGRETAVAQGMLREFGVELEARYLAALRTLDPEPATGASPRAELRIAYTALHGVGERLLRQAMTQAGFGALHSVAEQAEPDGAFPTVAFPNPEEPGALDRVLTLARDIDAALILANDPDADRLAAAVRTARGSYRTLSGNEIGVLLGHRMLVRSTTPERALVVATVVSSPQLGAIARTLGAHYTETLTGFKWIAHAAMAYEARGIDFLFGYEEALGYTVGDVVRDKDGIGTAMVFACLAAELWARGETLLDELERIHRRFGLFVSRQRSLTHIGSEGAARIAAMMTRLRTSPPEAIADHAVVARQDILEGKRYERGASPRPLDMPPSDVMVFELEGGHRVIARPSGTEPKIKLYFDVCEPLGPGEALSAAEARAAERLAALEKATLSLAEA